MTYHDRMQVELERARRVLLVGGSAFLGGHVVSALLRDLGSPSITVMDLRPYEGPHADRVENLRADLTSAEDCARVLGSAPYDVVISMVTPDLMRATAEDFQRVNVDGIRTLVAACRDHGVRGLVYISSIAVMDHFRDHVDVDECEPLPPLEQYRSPYDRSKRLGEEAVLAADSPGGLRTCSLRMGGILSDMRDPGLRYLATPWVVLQGHGRRIDMIDGFNAARGIVMAVSGILENPDEVGGEAFFITKGRAVTTYEYFAVVASRLGHRLVVMPRWVRGLLLGALRFGHAARRLLGRQVPGIPLHDFLRIQGFTQTFDNSKAHRILGYSPRGTLEDALAAIVDAYVADRSKSSDAKRARASGD